MAYGSVSIVDEDVEIKHEHKWCPVDVLWLHGETVMVPDWVVLACACGAVKLVRAWMVYE